MAKQLNIRSDEAHRLAHIIADRTGRPVVEVVVDALRELGAKLPADNGMTPAQRAQYEALRALSEEAAKHRVPGATSDHSDMYDEHGLPI
jgi:antitoxin VapB